MKERKLFENDEMKQIVISSSEARKVIGSSSIEDSKPSIEIKITIPIGN